MSETAAKRARPLSPHLSVYRMIPTMAMSIVHRITGAALYFGTLLVAWWLIAAAISERQFDIASGVLGSWIGLIVLLGFTWALVHHMLGGVRHLVWDTGHGLGKETTTALAWATLAGSILLTALIWAAVLMLGG